MEVFDRPPKPMEKTLTAPVAKVKKKIERRGRGRHARLTYDQMLKIRAHFEHGTKSQRELARDNGIDAAMIGRYAKKEGWAVFGSKREEAMAKATEKIVEATVKTYTEVINEVNARHLMSYRGAAAGLDNLLSDTIKRIKWVQASNVAAEAAALTHKDAKGNPAPLPLPMPKSTASEALTMERIVNAMRTAIIEGERVLLNIKDGAIEKEDPSNGANEIVRILEDARKEYGVVSHAPSITE